MLDGLWKKADDLFAAFSREMDSIFRPDGSIRVKSNGITFTESDGHVEIAGEFKSLKINGRLVRFKE